MEQQSEKSVWLPPFEAPSSIGVGPGSELNGLAPTDVEAAERLAALHLEIAAELPIDSRVRALALRCAGHWSRLAGLPRRGLSRVP